MNKQVEQKDLRELNLQEVEQVSGGLLGPDQDISDFPVWALPRILVAVNAASITAKTAQIAR